MMTTTFLSLLTFFRFSSPSLEVSEWKRLNNQLKQKLAPLHFLISNCSFSSELSVLGNQVSLEISNFCNENKELFAEEFKPSQEYVNHGNKTIAQLEKYKKELRKEAFKAGAGPEKRKLFHEACKAVSELKKREKKRQDEKTTAFQEKKFNSNRYKFAKEIVNGTFGANSVNATFDKVKADQHYPDTYSIPRDINLEDLHWYPPALTSPQNVDFKPFDSSPIRPRDIRKVLMNSNKNSAPGPDGVPFSVLLKLESTHHILSTLFTKVQALGAPPTSWGESVVKLIHKKGEASDPTNFRMIALSGCVGKTFHLLLNSRLTSFLIDNKLIDPTMQKAFLPGINGCIEHNLAMEEIMKDARKQKRTAHITFFDLEDAFGSVPHSLIIESLKMNFLPQNIIDYFSQLYSSCQAVVQTPTWRSDPFHFRRGVFQGDPLSPTIFLMVFNPVLLQLKNMEEKHGYKLHTENSTTSTITLPYADDFCLITTDLRWHRKIINTIQSSITSMGMRLKPSKCRHLSITSGKSTDSAFYIGDNRIPSIRDEEQKFLGRVLHFSGKSEETLNLIKDILKAALENIEASMVRSEYKLWILKHYLLPSKRFLLTVHTLPTTHLKTLDTFVDKFTKKWSGVPKSATNVILHSEQGLDIPTISALYTEAHNVSHARTRLQGDKNINNVLDHAVQRESTYIHMMGTKHQAEQVYLDTIRANTVGGNLATLCNREFSNRIRKQVKEATRQKEQEKQVEHAETLQVQGHLLTLAAKEKQDLLWKASMFQLKSGTLKFMMNASIDTLPTPANLRRWKYTTSDKCKLCGNKGTTNHILNCCKTMLDTDRYTWRHNNLVNFIVTNVDKNLTVFSDLPGMEAPGGGTIPPELCVTRLKPDIVIVDTHTKTLHIYELTMPMMANIDARHNEKTNKYSHFLTDISGYKCNLNCFEVTSTGFVSTRNQKTLHKLHSLMRKDLKRSVFMNNLNSLAWYGSYQIWLSREDPTFTSPSFLIPHLDLPQ